MVEPQPTPEVPALVVEPRCVPEGAVAFGWHHLVMGGHFVIQFALQPSAIDLVMDAP